MKNTIFYTIKSVLKYWCIFSCYLKAGFSSFFWTNAFTKKLVFYGTLLLLGLGFTTNTYGQLVGGAAVKANFGIEADAYANLLQFGSLPNQAGTDDWFNTTYPGSGKGVIDVTGAAALRTSILGNNNFSFTKGQSVTTPAPGFPYPIVDGYLWIDSVYGRDTNSAQSNNDSSIFTSTSDKNSDNPSTWNLGSGSVPQKDDIIDVMAHLRGTNPHDPSLNPGFPIDDRPFDELWAYAAATLRSTSGSKHIDFEFFRTLVTYAPGDAVFGNTGNDGGRTAFTFNANGSVNVPGTIIVSIDYEGGGSKPDVRIRVWMEESVFNGYNNSAALRPFSVVPGTFIKGEASGNFGYGRIVSNDPVDIENIFGRVNVEDTTLGPPWGTIEGSTATFFDHYQILQHVEIGINLTAFGLDRKGPGSGPCANVLGSLLVKTRSSAGGQSDNFTSEQKDFAGPFPFGSSVPAPVVATTNLTACKNADDTQTFDLNNGVTNNGGGTVTFHTTEAFADAGTNAIANPTTYLVTSANSPKTIWVRSIVPSRPSCYGKGSFTITVNTIIPGVIAGSQTLCTPFNPDAFTSTTAGSGGGTITYQWQSSTTSAVAGFSNIGGATSATYDAPAVAVVTWFRRTATSTLNSVACSDNSNVLVVTPNAISPGEIAGSQTLCTPFNPDAFTSTTPGSGGGTITYQWQISTTSAVAGFSNIGGATSATYDAPAVAVVTWFRRTATSTLNSVACSDNSNVLVVTPNAISPGIIAGNQTLCTPADPAAFTSTTLATGGGVITYQWQISTTSCDSGFSNIGGATSATYDAPTVAGATYFRRVATSTLNGVACSANSNCLTITPEDIHPGEIAGSQTLCTPFNPVAFTSVTPGTNGGTITYQWQISTTSCDAGFSNIGGATSATYDAPAVAVVTYFRRVATSTLNEAQCAANSNCLVVTPNAISPGEIAGSQTLCSPFNPDAFTSTTAGSGGGTITYQWQISTTSAVAGFSNIGGATSATYDAPAVAVVTWFRRTATSTLNSVACSDNSNVLVVTPNAISPGEIAGSQTLCTPFNPDAFTSTTPGSGGGTITYQWQSSTTSAVAGFSNIGGATSATYDAPAVAVVTWFRRTATSTLNSVACSDNSNVLVVTPNAVSSGTIAGDQKVCPNDDPLAFTSTTPGSGDGTITYQWQSNTTGCGNEFANIQGATSATYDPGVATATTYYRRVTTSTLNGVVCSANSNCLTVTVEICAAAICTYTQGYYGNVGGKSCAEGIQYSTKELIAKALTSYGGTMTIGLPGHSVYVVNNMTDINALIAVMPGGGGSYVLSAGNYEINNLPSSYLKKGRINNTLLAQTIALGLNIGINSNLGNFVLQAGSLAVAVPEGGCGSDIPKTRTCNEDGSVTNEYKYYTIPSDVVTALGANPTVQGLFDLANQALGGGSTNGLSLSKIAGLVDLINNAFDECRIPVGYNVPECPGYSLVPTDSQTELAGFTASPVPFKDQLTIRYNFDYKSDVKIEVFNAQGGLVLSQKDTNSFLNKNVTLNLNVSKGQEQVFIVKLTTDRGSSTKKVMSSQ